MACENKDPGQLTEEELRKALTFHLDGAWGAFYETPVGQGESALEHHERQVQALRGVLAERTIVESLVNN